MGDYSEVIKAVKLDEKLQDTILKVIPIRVLLRVAKQRNEELKKRYGPYAAQKKITKCPNGCGEDVGVREWRRHREVCTKKPT